MTHGHCRRDVVNTRLSIEDLLVAGQLLARIGQRGVDRVDGIDHFADAGLRQALRFGAALDRIVVKRVGDQTGCDNQCVCLSGSVTRNSVPWPTTLVTSICPWWRCTMP